MDRNEALKAAIDGKKVRPVGLPGFICFSTAGGFSFVDDHESYA